MDFARKQLEKYGWAKGKGLGKYENGISEALKPKLKRGVTGVGHDIAAEFNEHWWTQLYNKAAGNVEVKEKNGKTKKIKTKDDKFKITSNTWQLNQKADSTDNKDQDGYSNYFVRKAVLTSGGSKTERLKESDSESEEEKEKKYVFKMTDEELFAACEGRTAHKGARHGLKATGKLARIERQEALLLTEDRFSGYSHAEKIKAQNKMEDVSLNSDTETKQDRKKKKKHKCEKRFSNDCASETNINDLDKDSNKTVKKNKKKNKSSSQQNLSSNISNDKEISMDIVMDEDVEKDSFGSNQDNKKKKKKRKHISEVTDEGKGDVEIENMEQVVDVEINTPAVKSKKKKRRDVINCDINDSVKNKKSRQDMATDS